MPFVRSSKIVSGSAANLYGIVADIERYPSVLNYVKAVRILKREGNDMTAEVRVGVGLIQFSYVCDITLTPDMGIDITTTRKPFKHLIASWQFTPVDEATTKIDYLLDSQFTSAWMEATAGAMLAQQLHYSLRAFEGRARNA